MATLAELVVKIGSDITGFDDGIKGINQKARKLGDDLTVIGAGLTAGITLPLIGVGTAAIMAGDKFEQATIGFTTMLGSVERAKSFLDELKDFAAGTPFEFPELVTSAQRLLAMGFAAKDVIPTLTTVGDAAAALGSGNEGMNRIIVALGQMSAAGKVTAQDMKQLTEAGIPAWKILAEAIGTDVAGAMKAVSDRSISAEVGIAALTKGMNEAFGGLMANQMQTFSGQLSSVKDQLFFIAQDLGTAVLPVAKDLLTNVIQPMVGELKEWTKWFSELDPATQRFAVGLAAVAAAAGPVLFGLGSIIKLSATFGSGLTILGSGLTKVIGAGAAAGGTGLAGFAAGALAVAAALAVQTEAIKEASRWTASFAEGPLLALWEKLGLVDQRQVALTEKTADYAKKLVPTADAARKLADEVNRGLEPKRQAADLTRSLGEQLDKATKAAGAATPKIADLTAALREKATILEILNQDWITHNMRLEDLKAAAEAARPALDTTITGVEGLGAAVGDMNDGVLDAVTTLPDLSNEAEKYGTKAKKAKEDTSDWGRAIQQMSTIVTDFGKNFGSTIFDLFSIGDFNRDLEAQADAFRDSLADRQSDMEKWRDDHAATLADMTEDFERSVADRQASFDEFVTDSAAKFEKFRDDLAKREAEDLKRLEDQTSDKEEDFGDYVEDSEKKIAKIRTKEKESVEDATFDFNENLRQRQRDFAQYEVEMERKIQFAVGKEKANLKAALEIKRQDLADWIEDNRIALERKAFEEKRDADAAVAEEQARLEKRKAQHQEFLDDQKAKAEEIRAANAEKLAEQEADLAASLAKKTAELDKWKTEANAKYAEDVLNHNASLDEKEADYQEYIDGINGKLDEIAAKHKTVWGEIGGLVKETILGENGFAGAITRFVGEVLVGKLFKELKHLGDVLLPGISGKIADIFGGPKTPGVPGVPGVPGTSPTGGVAGAAGGIMGTLGAIGAIGSMISGIIGNFQSAKMETTLNAIEESTRRSMIHLGEGGSSILDWTQEIAKIGWLQFESQQYLASAGGPLWSSHALMGSLHNLVRDETNAKLDRIANALEALASPQSAPVQVAVTLDGQQISESVMRRSSRRLAFV